MQTPNKGQPIDYSYIKQIVDQINKIQTEEKKTSSLTNGQDKVATTVPTKDVVIVTRYVETTISESQDATVSIKFDGNFTTIPVVTASIVSLKDGNNPERTTLAIESVTGSGCDILLRSIEKKTKKVGINVIAIGQHSAG